MAGKASVVEIEGKHLSLTNLDKILYPAAGFTKGQVIDYYARIAPVLLPHLKDHPLTLKRYPGGVNEEFFFEKNATKHRPDWVKTVPVWSEGNQRDVNYILANDLATLVWIANLAAIELHPSLSLAKDITSPRSMVFDLDPGAPANIVQCCQVGMWLRAIFEHFGLQSFPKTSGSKGLQIYVPINSPTSYEVTKPFAHALARLLEDEHRDLVVSDMKKQLRVGKVFVDWSQNDEHKTTISVYALRARERPTVSTPVTWDEVAQALKKKDANLLVFEANQVLDRVHEMGDLFEPVHSLKQKLPKLSGLAEIHPEVAEKGLDIAAQADGRAVRKTARKAKPAPPRGAKKEVAKGIMRSVFEIIPNLGKNENMAQLYAGTSGWAYPSWKPDFYPAKLAQAKFLQYYATQLNAVEVNFTFRQLLKETTAQKWIDSTPAGFRLSVKAHQVITHIKRLKKTEDFVPRFLSTIEPLERAGKLGPLLFQLPPNMKADATLLQEFLAVLPRAVPSAFEFRHASWFTDDIFTLLKNCNRALCVAETEERTTPDIVTADFCYYRYRKPTYSAEERHAMVNRIREHLQLGLDVFAYFKHEETPQGAIYAVEVLKEVNGAAGTESVTSSSV